MEEPATWLILQACQHISRDENKSRVRVVRRAVKNLLFLFLLQFLPRKGSKLQQRLHDCAVLRQLSVHVSRDEKSWFYGRKWDLWMCSLRNTFISYSSCEFGRVVWICEEKPKTMTVTWKEFGWNNPLFFYLANASYKTETDYKMYRVWAQHSAPLTGYPVWFGRILIICVNKKRSECKYPG